MRRYSWLFFVIILLVLFGFGHVSGSIGDRLRVFRQNLVDCIQSNCSDQNTYYQNKPFYLQLLRWDCVSECRYESQWRTLEYLKKSKILKVPQFYGKWTFYRFFGIQEPASFFFSILNLLANLRGWKQYRTIGILCNDRYYNVWKLQAILAINAWFWSIIYHSRDCPFTEKLDYFSAYLTIIYSLFTITFKYLSELFDPNNDLTAQITIAIPFATIYLYHVNYLTTVRFDYGYNLRVNLLTGIGSTLGWLVWCLHHRKNRTHVKQCVMSLIFLNLCLIFEVLDFAPIFNTFDAHSLWHCGTILFPFLWYKFLQQEAKHLALQAKRDQ